MGFHRYHRTKHRDDFQVGGRMHLGVFGFRLIGIQRRDSRVCARVLVREALDRRIAQQLHGVAAHQVARKHPVPDEYRIRIRPVVIRDIQLDEPPPDARHQRRHAAQRSAVRADAEPERGIRGDHEPFRNRKGFVHGTSAAESCEGNHQQPPRRRRAPPIHPHAQPPHRIAELSRARDHGDALKQSLDLVGAGVAGTAGAYEPVVAVAQLRDNGARVEIAVRHEDASRGEGLRHSR